MKLPRPSGPTLSFFLPMLALPLGMLVISIMAVTQPVSVHPEPEPAPAAPEEPPEPTRVYHHFLTPITLSLPANRGTLNIEIGVALPKTFDRALEKTLLNKPDAILGNLASVIHGAVETQGSEADPAQLRALISEVLLHAINDNLVAMGEPPDILEVLIVDWALLR